MTLASRFFDRRKSSQSTAPTHSVTLGGAEPVFGAREAEEGQFLPLALKRELSRLAWRTGAFFLALFLLACAVALLSYNPLDPSWNTQTRAAPTNWLGRPGALIADLMAQGLGWGAWFLIGLGLVWCGGMARTFSAPRPLRRLMWATTALTLVCLALGLIDLLHIMAGGVVGFVLAGLVPSAFLKFLVFIAAALGAGWATLRALCFTRQGIRALFSAPAARLLSARQANLERRRSAADRPSLWARVSGLFARKQGEIADPATAQNIPAFLQSGPVATTPFAAPIPPQMDPQVSEGEDPQVAEPAVFAAADEEGIYEATAPAFQSEQDEEFDEEFDAVDEGFTAVDAEAEEIELAIARPKAKLIETPQLAKRKANAPAAPKPKSAAPATATYTPPPLDLLYEPTTEDRAAAMTQEEADAFARQLEETLRDYGVKGEIVRVLPGPVVTLYELEPAPGTKTSRVVGLADDIARSMSALSARIAPVPGKSVIGIELPNPTRETVFLHEMLADRTFTDTKAALPLALGKDIGGQGVMTDLAKMPHLLVAGTTGSGKSVAVNTMILSLVYALSPEQVRFIMIDPKILELSVYDGIPHLLSPVVTDPKKAVVALKWVVQEMNQRYQSMSTLNVRNIANFNTKIKNALANGETLTRSVQVGFCPDSGEPIHEDQAFDMRPLPHIVVIVDEMAELMLMVGKDIEAAIQSIAQKARAAGIHMIMATQRPSVDVITGTIKANFPSRISFAVSSKIDSRTVLNEMGAEQLLGQGDMLYQPNGGRTMRVHGPFASDDEVEAVVEHLKEVGAPEYIEAIVNEDVLEAEAGPDGLDLPLFEKESSGDDLYDRAVQVVLKDKKASTSHVQRRLQIGYNRAANLIDQMEDEGLITPADHVGRRKILVPGDSAAD